VWLVISRIVVLALASVCGAVAVAGESFERLPLVEVLRGTSAFVPDMQKVPLVVTVPKGWVRRTGDNELVGVLLGTQADVDATHGGDMKLRKSGVFRFSVSLNTIYNSKTNAFGNEGQANESGMLEAAGFTDIRFRRVDASGVPMRAFTAMHGDSRSYVLHIAMAAPAQTTLSVFYYPSAQSGQRDDEVWNQFVNGLAAQR